ncbi:MAG: thioredoxin-dependent thiol peroxidase [Deltaproteobacteria bacterium CG11_big_fil_rev_8_21_14_0_20_47_16]|nr:MAG: thioredoxin-dependent thiol peroxidase [Deltaproteobacteria bacterium CG11_big_fil_rev_8_21_14_0_20_47_16]
MPLHIGDVAPDFELYNQENQTKSARDYRGKYLILYFYPKDSTPGCTREACDFTANFSTFKNAGATIVGISPDSVKSHQKFIMNEALAIELLSDTEKTVAKAYMVWKRKKMAGKTYMGIERTTFIIDPNGKIAAIFPQVKVDGHWEEVLTSLNHLQKS